MSSSKPVVAVDIDDVLSAHVEGFVAFSNRRWGMALTAEDYDEDWGRVWQTGLAETSARAIEFTESGAMAAYRHFPEAEAVLRKLRRRFSLAVVTSRRKVLAETTQAWLDRHFPGVFEQVCYAGIWDNAKEGAHRLTKLEACRRIGAQYLIDDQPKHCLAAAEAGIRAILFGDYTWNRFQELPSGVVRCASWDQVEAYFKQEG